MRLAMAQMHMEDDVDANLKTTLSMMEGAKEEGADMVLFPEIQLSPFFPKYEKRDAGKWIMSLEGDEVKSICAKCRELGIWASPNLYLDITGKRYDASLMIDASGRITGLSKMVNICQAENFYEQDYYAPSDTGYRVYDTPFGKIGIVICYDRHIPGSFTACADRGAKLILVPTANLKSEPVELFEWEVRVLSYHNKVYCAMCNRTGSEDGFAFSGESLAAAPDGTVLFKAGDEEGLYCVDIPLS